MRAHNAAQSAPTPRTGDPHRSNRFTTLGRMPRHALSLHRINWDLSNAFIIL